MAVKYRQRTDIVKQKKEYTSWLLYFMCLVMLVPLIAQLMGGGLFKLLITGGSFFGLLLSAFWMGLGLRNKDIYQQREYASKAPIPLMFTSSLLTGGSVFVAGYLGTDLGLFSALGLSTATTVGQWLWYGLDPVGNGVPEALADDREAYAILNESENRILSIEKSNLTINNKQLSQKLNKICDLARDVLSVLSQEPKKISKARRFLYSYLEATESVIRRYADAHKKVDDQTLETNFKTVLNNIERVFAEQHEKLVSSDVFDLDVDIEVLNTLLEKQGIN